MKVSLVICFKGSIALLWVSRWKLRAEELDFPVPASHWQRKHKMQQLLGVPASLGAFSTGLQPVWCGISTGSATPSGTPWSDASRHQMLSVPGYWHQHWGCSFLFGSEFLN